MGCDNDAGSNKLKENSMVIKTKEDREMIFSISSPRYFRSVLGSSGSSGLFESILIETAPMIDIGPHTLVVFQ